MTRQPLLPTATAAAPVLFGAVAATPRNARADTSTISGNRSVSQSTATGSEPTTGQPNRQSFSQMFTVGAATAPTDVVSISPAGSSGACGTRPDHCNSSNDTASDTVTITFCDLSDGTPSTATDYVNTATYQANHYGTHPCSDNTGSRTDRLDWTGAATSPSGSSTDSMTFTEGAVFRATLNAPDSTIYPTIRAEPVEAPNSASTTGAAASDHRDLG
jgi:hypothetical protein